MTDTAALDPTCRRLLGIVPSQNTPFAADGGVDYESIRRAARASVAAGVAGMLILAVASENRALSIAERERIGRVFVEEVSGRVPVIVAVSAPDIETALVLTRQAVAMGADAVCYQAPLGLPRGALSDQIGRICDLGPPLFVLQDLDWTGPGLSMADIEWLFAHHQRFRAIKVEADPAGPRYTEILKAFGGRLHVSGGWAAAQMIEALQRGVHAFMPTAMDYIYTDIHRLFVAGREDEARILFERMLPFIAFSNQHIDLSIRFYKRVRHLDGTFATDHCRPPTPALDPYQEANLDHLARRAVLLDARLREERQADIRT